MKGRLSGQVAWIGGGASGIGEATSRLFAMEGAKVAIVDVQAERGKQLERDIQKTGGDVIFIACDVTSEEQIRNSIEKTVANFGGLQAIINCAGVVHVALLHEYSSADWDRLMDVNIKSIFLSVKHGIDHLRKNDRSYMVNVGSISSFVGQAATPAYTASKFAVLGLSRSIALDYAADGLRCNCVCPGMTDTPMLRYHLNALGDPAGTMKARVHRIPIGRALTPDDIARSILYLSCEDSAGVTATSLVVDGGTIAAAEWNTADISLPSDLS